MSNDNTQLNKAPATEHEMRQLLNDLSKAVYGTSSKWKKLVNNGAPERVAQVEGSNVTYTTRRFTLAEVFEHMVEVKAKHDAELQARRDALEVAKTKKELEDSLTGSAAL